MKEKGIRAATCILSVLTAAWCCCPGGSFPIHAATGGQPGLWELARSRAQGHRFSTLFTAQDVRDRLATDEGIDKAIAWCRQTGVTKVYLESFRDGPISAKELAIST